MSPNVNVSKSGCPARASRGLGDPLGLDGEALAEGYLRAAGYDIIARRWRAATTNLGEIDLIAQQGREVVFVEVKTRSSEKYGAPELAVTPEKQRRLLRTAICFLNQRQWQRRPWRVDVIGIVRSAGAPPRLRHLIGAVEAGE